MSPRTTLAFLVCAAVSSAGFVACGGPETFHLRGNLTGQGGGSGGGAGAAGAGGAAGSGTAGTTGAAGTTGPVIKIDSSGTANAPFIADVDFNGGNDGQVNNGAVDLTGVTNPAPAAVYQTTR